MAFTLALSLAVTIISGFILNLLPSGLRLLPWVLWLGLLTLLFSLLAYMRRHRLEEEEPVDMTIVVPTQRFRVQISALILFGLAILVVVLSVIYSVVGAEQQSHPGFTNLWMLQATQGTNTCAVSIGMQSFELTVVTYRIVVTTNSAQTASWSGISLTPQQQWAHLQPIPVGTNTAVTVLVQVYRLDQPQTVYLHTHILLHVTTKGTAKECTSA
jgi:uncharacterized membrane protein